MFLNKKQSTLPTLALLTIAGFATACSNSSSGDAQTATASEQQEQTPAEAQIGSETQDASSENEAVVLPESVEENDSSEQSNEAEQNGESNAEPSSETEPIADVEAGATESAQADDPTNQPSSILTADNANAVILQAFEVFTERAYDNRLSAHQYVKQAPLLRNSVMTPGYIWWRWGNEAIGHLSEPLPSVS